MKKKMLVLKSAILVSLVLLLSLGAQGTQAQSITEISIPAAFATFVPGQNPGDLDVFSVTGQSGGTTVFFDDGSTQGFIGNFVLTTFDLG